VPGPAESSGQSGTALVTKAQTILVRHKLRRLRVRPTRKGAGSPRRTHLIRFVPEIITPLVPFTESYSHTINCPMNNLITVVTRFQLPAGINADQIRAAFEEAAPKFRTVPGVVRKQFLHSKEDSRTVGGVYLWNDERAARAFMNERVVQMIREKFHVEPTIEFYDSPVIVEN